MKKINNSLKFILTALIPLVACMIYCLRQGTTIADVYLPASEWNDELFYFKQVEAMCRYGAPLGYFGFNESHALVGSYAAWSPVLVLPWVIIGYITGWSLMTPIVCNIILLTVALVLFVYLTDVDWPQLGVLAFLFILYTPFVRYMLSGMPEVICFSLLIIFFGVVIRYCRTIRKGLIPVMFMLSGLLTLMRPYMVLFMIIPSVIWTYRYRWRAALGSVGIIGGVMGVYACIKHFLGAEYFAPLFYTDWLTTFFTEGFMAGLKNFLSTLFHMGRSFIAHIIEAFRSGLCSGAIFASFIFMMLMFAYTAIVDSYKCWNQKGTNEDRNNAAYKRIKSKCVAELGMLFAMIGMLFALLLMYKLTEGSKHLLTFMAAGVCLVAVMETKFYKKAALLGLVFAYLFNYMAVSEYDYLVPFGRSVDKEAYSYWADNLPEAIELDTNDIPKYDNVVIWTFSDQVGDEIVNTKWQYLYYLPEGTGISCCYGDYVRENLTELHSRYLAVVAGGEIDRMCNASGYTEVLRDQDLVIYDRWRFND